MPSKKGKALPTVGSKVILHKHRMVKGRRNWVGEMDQYVGKEAKVFKIIGKDLSGCKVAQVDLDGGLYFWRIQNMTVVK